MVEAFPSNLPLQLTSFIGREPEIVEVKRQLSHTRLLTLIGAGGCGKTRLALRVAGELLDEYPDGIWFVDLAPLSHPSLVPQAVASVFNLHETPETPLIDLITNFLHTKILLLVLDNCEHLIQACAELSDALLRACPELKLLATSREALNIGGETAFRVPSLSIPDPVKSAKIETLNQYESVRLFVERASAARSDFHLTDANATGVAQICQRLDGIPLAIELAAARVKSLDVEQIAARLDNSFRLLTSGSRTALPRQQTLRATIDWSFDLLPESERVFLSRLSVFAGGWTIDAAEEVCSNDAGAIRESPLPKAIILDLLSHLIDKSLVLAEEQDGVTRYRMLETIRQYGREKLVESGETAAVQKRHLDFFFEWLHYKEGELKDRHQLAALAEMDLEIENARAAWMRAIASNRLERIAPATEALMGFFSLRGRLAEGAGLCKVSLESANLTPYSLLRAQILAWKGKFEGQLGRTRGAGVELNQCLDLLNLAEDGSMARSVKAFALLQLGVIELLIGEREKAKRLYEQSLAAYQDLGDQWSVANVLSALGRLAWQVARYTEAEQRHRESLAIRQTIGDRRGIAESLDGLGAICMFSGQLEEAMRLAKESLQIYREINDKTGIAHMIGQLGAGYNILLGDYPKAIENMKQAVLLNQELGRQERVAWWMMCLGLSHNALGQYEQARQVLENSLSLARETKHERCVAWSLLCLGLAEYGLGDSIRANQLLSQAVEKLRQINQPIEIARALANWGIAWRALGKADKAWEIACESLKLASEIDIWYALVDSLPLFAALLADRGHVERAVEVYAMLRRYPCTLSPFQENTFGRVIDNAAASLPADVAAAAQARGQSLDIHETARELVIAYAFPEQVTASLTIIPPHDPNALTPREIEVLRLARAGLSDAKIAEKLVISRRTVNTHLSAIYSKLGVSSRSAATHYALDHKLI